MFNYDFFLPYEYSNTLKIPMKRPFKSVFINNNFFEEKIEKKKPIKKRDKDFFTIKIKGKDTEKDIDMNMDQGKNKAKNRNINRIKNRIKNIQKDFQSDNENENENSPEVNNEKATDNKRIKNLNKTLYTSLKEKNHKRDEYKINPQAIFILRPGTKKERKFRIQL